MISGFSIRVCYVVWWLLVSVVLIVSCLNDFISCSKCRVFFGNGVILRGSGLEVVISELIFIVQLFGRLLMVLLLCVLMCMIICLLLQMVFISLQVVLEQYWLLCFFSVFGLIVRCGLWYWLNKIFFSCLIIFLWVFLLFVFVSFWCSRLFFMQ